MSYELVADRVQFLVAEDPRVVAAAGGRSAGNSYLKPPTTILPARSPSVSAPIAEDGRVKKPIRLPETVHRRGVVAADEHIGGGAMFRAGIRVVGALVAEERMEPVPRMRANGFSLPPKIVPVFGLQRDGVVAGIAARLDAAGSVQDAVVAGEAGDNPGRRRPWFASLAVPVML